MSATESSVNLILNQAPVRQKPQAEIHSAVKEFYQQVHSTHNNHLKIAEAVERKLPEIGISQGLGLKASHK